MKKLLVLLLVIGVMLPIMSVSGQDGPVIIRWWATERGRDTAATRELHYQLARQYEADHPGTIVEVALYPSRAFATRVFTAIAAGQGPDIWYHYYSPDTAQQGFLADLTEYVEASGVADSWFPSAARRAVYNGRYYGVPRDAVSGFIVYNKDIFDAAGMPYPEEGWTVADYRETAKALTNIDAGIYGAGAIEGGDGCMQWSTFSFNLGAEITSPDGRQVVGYLDSPEAIEAMRWCLELVTEDQSVTPVEMMDQYGEVTFMSGQVAMQHISDWEIPALMEQADFEWGVVAPPRFNEDTPVIPWTDSYVYYMWEGSPNKDAAWGLLEFLTGPVAQKMAAEAGVWAPNGPTAWQELGWDTDPIRSVSYNQLVNSERVPNYLRSQFFFTCVNLTDIRTLWVEAGERDLERIMTEAAASAQACLDDNYANLPTP